MFADQRRQKILELLRTKEFLTVSNLAQELDVSSTTIQRDLAVLKNLNLVHRAYGGVRLNSDALETRFDIRLRSNEEAKRRIAIKALEYVERGDSIFIDASSTCAIFAEEIFRSKVKDIAVVSTSPFVLTYLYRCPRISVICPGGELVHDFCALWSTMTQEFLSRMSFDKAFVSVGALTAERGPMTSQMFIRDTLRTVFGVSREINLLVDSSKIGKMATMVIAPLNAISRIITETEVPEPLQMMMDQEGVELVISD